MKVLKFGSLADWRKVEKREALTFGGKVRTVRLHVQAPAPVSVMAAYGSSPEVELARERGQFTVEAVAPFDLWFSEPVLIKTAELVEVTVKNEAQESFTRMMVRKARNPELELMMYQMRENERRRDAQLQRQLAAFEAAVAARNARANSEGEVIEDEPDREGAAGAAQRLRGADPDEGAEVHGGHADGRAGSAAAAGPAAAKPVEKGASGAGRAKPGGAAKAS